MVEHSFLKRKLAGYVRKVLLETPWNEVLPEVQDVEVTVVTELQVQLKVRFHEHMMPAYFYVQLREGR